MKNLKVRTKILVSFGICVIMTLILGITSVMSVRQMNGVASNYVEISIPATTKIWTARRAIQATQKLALEVVVTKTELELNSIGAKMDDEAHNIETALQELLEITPQFETGVNRVLADLETVEQAREDMMTECRKLTQEGNDRAYQIYKSEYEPAFDQVVDDVLIVYDSINEAITTRYEDAQQTALTSTITVIAVILISLIIVISMTLILSKQLTMPIVEIMRAMRAVGEGRLKDAHVRYQSKDELGRLSGTVRDTIHIFQEIVSDVTYLSNEIGRGNFAVESQNREIYVGEYLGILDGMRHIRNNLTETMEQIDVAAGQMLAGAEQVANGAQALSQGATEQASSVEELAATIANINDKVKLASENADVANRFTMEAGTGVKESNVYMADLMKAMDNIQVSASEIGKIIKNIDDIAFQTNILALNAAVEAARAGAAGKGFAVVADEVRNLAGKSAEAAKTTTTLIENAINAVETGMQSAQATSDAMKDVAEKANVTVEKMQEISDATNEQAEAIAQLSIGIDQIASVTQNNSATSEESAAASEELSSQAGFLKELTGRFTLYEGEGSTRRVSAEPSAAATPVAEQDDTPAPVVQHTAAPVHTPAPLHDSSFDYDSKY